MSVSEKVKSYLKDEGVAFEVMEHPAAYTALEVASLQHVPGRQMVKTVIVKSNGEFLMCVLPAIHMVDFEKLKFAAKLDDVQLAEENEVENLFPEYEKGAEPPFGHLYGLKIFVDKSLEKEKEIVFNAGTHTDVIKVSYEDYKKLAHPVIAEIGTHI